jgi:hypothetical protein
VRFDNTRIYPQRVSDTLSSELIQGPVSEQALYDETTNYLQAYFNRATEGEGRGQQRIQRYAEIPPTRG